MTVSAPPPPDFPWGPVVSGLGIAVSLIWNFINTRLAQSVKKQDRRLDEFKRLRTRLDTALDQERATIATLRSLSVSASNNKQAWLKELEKQNTELAANDGKVRAILDAFNRSPYVHGEDWIDVLAPHWDNAVNSLNGSYNTTSGMADRKKCVADSAAHLEAMIAAVEGRLDNEMGRYAARVVAT